MLHLFPEFRAKVEKIVDEMSLWCEVHLPDYAPFISEGFRTTARQQELYAQGRTKPGDIVTQKNGTTNPSNHQSAMAVDIVLAKNGQPTWDLPEAAWQYLGHLARAQGLVWGGDWRSPVDKPHIEWPVAEQAAYARARLWKAKEGLK